MYGSRSRKVKTDGRDTAALFDACRSGIYRRAHRVSASQRARRQQLRIRRHLVQMRGRDISLLARRCVRKGGGCRAGRAETIDRRVEALALPVALRAVLSPLRTWLGELNAIDRGGGYGGAPRWRRAIRSPDVS